MNAFRKTAALLLALVLCLSAFAMGVPASGEQSAEDMEDTSEASLLPETEEPILPETAEPAPSEGDEAEPPAEEPVPAEPETEPILTAEPSDTPEPPETAEPDPTAAPTEEPTPAPANDHVLAALESMGVPLYSGEDGPYWPVPEGLILDGATPEGDPDLVLSWPLKSKYVLALDHYSSGGTHGGMDIAADVGSEVRAVADGTVVLVSDVCPHYNNTGDTCSIGNGWTSGYGNCVILQHVVNGKTYTSVYGHLKQGTLEVKSGDTVTEGQLLGLSGSSGNSSGPHLHLEVHPGTYWGWGENRSKAVRGQSLRYFLNNPITLTGMTFAAHIVRTSDYFGDWITSNCTLSDGVYRYSGPTATPTPSPTPPPTPEPTATPVPTPGPLVPILAPTPTPNALQPVTTAPLPTVVPWTPPPIRAHIIGDLDGDNMISRADRILLARSLTSSDSFGIEPALCDVTGDGIVDASDFLNLTMFLSGWTSFDIN